jgi:hypothetical protein
VKQCSRVTAIVSHDELICTTNKGAVPFTFKSNYSHRQFAWIGRRTLAIICGERLDGNQKDEDRASKKFHVDVFGMGVRGRGHCRSNDTNTIGKSSGRRIV